MLALTLHLNKKKKVMVGHEKDTHLNKKKKLMTKETHDVREKPYQFPTNSLLSS